MSVIIDSVFDYEQHGAILTTKSDDTILFYIKKNEYILLYVLETHVHADHLTAASYIREKTGAKIGISEVVTDVQKIFGDVFSVVDNF